MTEKKRKQMNDTNLRSKKSKTNPRSPSSLNKQIQTNVHFDEATTDVVYEYEEQDAEEESMKNKRYDPVSVKDRIPSHFKDENVQSDNEFENDDDCYIGTKRDANAEGRHVRMIQGITGMPTETFQGNAENKKLMMSDAFDPSCEVVVCGDGLITIEDLLNPNFVDHNKLKIRVQSIEKNGRTMHTPLPEADQAKVERKVAYVISKKYVTKYQPFIQTNRDATTISFYEKVDIGFSTIGAIASEFRPRSKFEREVAALVLEAHRDDGSRLNKVSKEDRKERQNRAKLRSLLFCNEKKAKRIKKIKSGTFHRHLKKDRLKSESSRIEMDSKVAKKYDMKKYFKRAEERMTLRHTHHNRWAKNVKQHGLNHKYEETRAAMDENCRKHKDLTRKMHSMKGSSSSNDSEDDDENSAGSDLDSKILGKLMKVLGEKDEITESRLSSLGFMRRGLKKSREAVVEECEDLLKNLEDFGSSEDRKAASTSGRRVFGKAKAHVRLNIKHTEGNDADTDSEGKMVGGIPTSTSKPSYELPSQEELIRQTFAGDDVEAEFQKDKQKILDEENPEPEKPILLGWGQWTDTQQKKGLPYGQLKQNKDALRKRDETLKKRNDAQLKNVIISEKSSKKTEKLYTKVLPYPHTSKEAFEQNMRMPMGPECNPTTATGLLNQPEVVKRPGVIIKPIRV